ncbi:MAG TPA: hypothetical protein VMT34_13025 [Aggregatilineales bacterium]|nr:hypothetical protein [Aggregatilineales bacterium]
MSITFSAMDLIYLLVGIGIGLLIPHGHRYVRRYYGSYRRRRY